MSVTTLHNIFFVFFILFLHYTYVNIHLGRKQNFPKNQHFLSSDTYTYMCVSGDKNC